MQDDGFFNIIYVSHHSNHDVDNYELYVIEGFVREQIRLKLQIADGQADSTKLKAMVKH